MCHNPNDLPPDPPGDLGQAAGEDLELVSADGTHFAAYIAHPTHGRTSRANVIIYPDVRGLHNFYKELALRFAEQGIHAIAIDYFGRTAGLTPRDENFEFRPHVDQIEYPNFLADVRAATSYLQNHANFTASVQYSPSIFTLGFCMGGSLSLFTSAEDLPLSGAIAFYAGLLRRFATHGINGPTPLEQSPNIRCPILFLYGGADPGVPENLVQELGHNLDTSGIEHQMFCYPGAPHSFFDRAAAEYAEASADAWNRVLSFISAHAEESR
jgi:carboxymethylenebutenolidase